MIFINLEDVLFFHKKIIKQTGGADGIIDKGKVDFKSAFPLIKIISY